MNLIYTRKIFGHECDLYGHLNNAKYLNLFEEARSEAMEQTNFTLDILFDLGIFMYVRNVNLDFIKSIPVGSEVSVESNIIKFTKLRSVWQQTIKNTKDEICAVLTIDVVFIKDKKPSRLPKNIYEELGKLVEG